MTKRFGAVCLQLGPQAGSAWTKDDEKAHLAYLLERIDWAVDMYSLCSPMGVKLIVGPELAVYGYQSPSCREMNEKYAIEIPGPETEALVQKAKDYNCYISPGSFVERDTGSSKHLFFNTQFLVGPQGLLYRYRKTHPWFPHEPSVSPHDLLGAGYDTDKYPLFPVVETEIGRLGGWICYDALFPEIARQLAFNGCEIFLGSTAYMDPYGQPPLDLWHVCCRARSIENMAYGVYCGSGNGLSALPPFPTSGGSFIADFEGRVLSRCGPGEAYAHAILDIDALRDHRKHMRLENHLAHLRTEAFTYLQKQVFPPQNQFADCEELTLIEADEINAKALEKFWGEYYGEKVEVPTWRPPSWACYKYEPGK